jgi:hypothetical protein
MGVAEIGRLVVLSLTTGFGWSVIAYAGYAKQRCLPVGALLAGNSSWLQGIAWIAIGGGVVTSGYFGAWWQAVFVLVAANILVRILFSALGPKSQVVSALGVLVGIPTSMVLLWQ